MSTIAKVSVFLLVGIIAATLFVPQVRQVISRSFSTSETVVLPTSNDTLVEDGPEVRLVTLLGYDAIPAILSPEFVDADFAERWMKPDEQVLGLSINGDNRAYSIPMLSRHEIVNDTVGGVPVAITW